MIYSRNGVVVRVIYLVISLIFFVISFGGMLFRGKKVILCYHGIDDCYSEKFRTQMLKVSSRIIPLSTEVDLNGRGAFLWPKIVVTFDDAFQNLNKNVLPVIAELQIPVAIYVVTNSMGTRPAWLKGSQHKDERKLLMSTKDVYDLSLNPLVLIGTHSCNHFEMTSLSEAEVTEEICKSKDCLEEIIGRNVESIAFPHGDYNEGVTKRCFELGLTSLLTLDERLVPLEKCKGALGRFSMEPNIWLVEFYLTVSGAYCWLLPFRKAVRFLREYKTK